VTVVNVIDAINEESNAAWRDEFATFSQQLVKPPHQLAAPHTHQSHFILYNTV